MLSRIPGTWLDLSFPLCRERDRQGVGGLHRVRSLALLQGVGKTGSAPGKATSWVRRGERAGSTTVLRLQETWEVSSKTNFQSYRISKYLHGDGNNLWPPLKVTNIFTSFLRYNLQLHNFSFDFSNLFLSWYCCKFSRCFDLLLERMNESEHTRNQYRSN